MHHMVRLTASLNELSVQAGVHDNIFLYIWGNMLC